MENKIDATEIISHSRENDSEFPVTTARYLVEIVMNEENHSSSEEEMKKQLSDEIQRVMDHHRFTESMRYDSVNFVVISREVLDIAPPRVSAFKIEIAFTGGSHYISGYIKNDLMLELCNKGTEWFVNLNNGFTNATFERSKELSHLQNACFNIATMWSSWSIDVVKSKFIHRNNVWANEFSNLRALQVFNRNINSIHYEGNQP